MFSQIIFFAAIALLIILLLRKATFAKGALEVVGRVSRQLGGYLAAGFNLISLALQSLVGTIKRRQSSPSASRPLDDRRFAGDIKAPTPQEHRFWQEEAISDKLELSSHFDEGENLYKVGKFDAAEQFFVKAAASNPADPKIYARLGLLYLQTKNYSDAIEALKVAVKLDKYNPSRHYNLALAYWGNKDVQRAISSAREAITLDPVTPKYRQLLEQLLNS